MKNPSALPQTSSASVRPLFVIVGVVLATVALAFWQQPINLWPARLLLLGLWIVTAVLLVNRSQSVLLLSPIAIMGGISHVAYSLLPALTPFQKHYYFSLMRHDTYLNSFAEALVIGFSAVFLIVLLVMAAYYNKKNTNTIKKTIALHPFILAGLITTLIGSIAFQILFGANIDEPGFFAASGIWKQIHHALPPLQTSVLTLLFIDSLSRGPKAVIGVLVLVAGTIIMLTTVSITKVPILHAAGLILAWFILSTLTLKRRLIILSMAMIGLFIALISSYAFKPTYGASWHNAPNKAAHLIRVTSNILTGRQFSTGICLHDIIKNHWPAWGEGTPFYFSTSIVPRVFWPQKPSLSKGQYYAVRYCDTPPGSQHTASVTLIGEPIIQAGAAGLAAALGTLIILLSGITWIALKTAPFGLVVLVSTIPWLIDFDQHFALYFANAVKMGIIVMITVFVVAWVQRQLDRHAQLKAAS